MKIRVTLLSSKPKRSFLKMFFQKLFISKLLKDFLILNSPLFIILLRKPSNTENFVQGGYQTCSLTSTKSKECRMDKIKMICFPVLLTDKTVDIPLQLINQTVRTLNFIEIFKQSLYINGKMIWLISWNVWPQLELTCTAKCSTSSDVWSLANNTGNTHSLTLPAKIKVKIYDIG